MRDIRACNQARGGHWFERGAMRFFRSRVGSRVYQGRGGIYFISSEQFVGSGGYSEPRKFSVRKFNPRNCSVSTKNFQKFRSGREAAALARCLASGKCKE